MRRAGRGLAYAMAVAGWLAGPAFAAEPEELPVEAVVEAAPEPASALTVRIDRALLGAAAMAVVAPKAGARNAGALELAGPVAREGIVQAPQMAWVDAAGADGGMVASGTLSRLVAYGLGYRYRAELRYLQAVEARVTIAGGRARLRLEGRFVSGATATVLAFEARFLAARPGWLERALGPWGRRLDGVTVRADREVLVVEASLATGHLEELVALGLATWAALPAEAPDDDERGDD